MKLCHLSEAQSIENQQINIWTPHNWLRNIRSENGEVHAGGCGANAYVSELFQRKWSLWGGNPPIGIILCADKSETLVKYATAGLPQPIFVSKYMTNLPSERELQDIIQEERRKNIGMGDKKVKL